MTRHIFSKSLLAAFCLSAAALVSCSDNDDPVAVTVNLAQTQLNYDSEGLWDGAYTDARITSQFITFSHHGEIGAWGPYSQGFVASRSAETGKFDNMIAHQYDCIAGGGVAGKGTPFLLANWNSSETDATPLDERSCAFWFSATPQGDRVAFRPVKVKVCNSSYAYYTMLDGNAFSRKFEAGDKFTLTAHGVHADGSESTASFLLADCTGDPSGWFVTDWTDWDLSTLGQVTAVYFTMDSTDSGQWGMNTPAYFCFDRLEYEGRLPE